MGENDKGKNAIDISDFLRPKHYHINSCEESTNPSLTRQFPVFVLHSHSLCGYSFVSTHLLTYISADSGSMATADLLSLTLFLPAPHSTSIVTMKEVLKSTVSPSPLRNKNRPLVAMTQSPGVARRPPGICPFHIPGDIFGSDLAWVERSGPRVNTTLALSLVPFILCQKFCFGSQGSVLLRIYSMCWGTVPLLSQELLSVIFIFLSDIAV